MTLFLSEIQVTKNLIITSIGEIYYDFLVLAMGTSTNFYGNKNIEMAALPMKTVTDALELRNTILTNFEQATVCHDNKERCALLNVVIVGGGATGIEIAGAISEMKRFVVPKYYLDSSIEKMHIHLIEASDHLLSGMSKESSDKTLAYLRAMGVNVILHERVTDYIDHHVILNDGTSIPSRNFIWVSGVKGASIKGLDNSDTTSSGRLLVNQHNLLESTSNIFAIGDICYQTDDPNYPKGHPQVAQVAIQQAKNLSYNLRQLSHNKPLREFRYRNLGSMATIGSSRAVAEKGKLHAQGWVAWILWFTVHLMTILGVRNKVNIFFDWFWYYLKYDYSLQIILNHCSDKTKTK